MAARGIARRLRRRGYELEEGELDRARAWGPSSPASFDHERGMSCVMLADEFLPVYDVSDEVAAVVQADVQTTWDALIDADLIEVGRQRPLVALLGAVRALPDLVWQRLHGEHPPAAPERLTLRDTTKLPMSGGGWVLLGERPPEQIALGLVGKFWRPAIDFAQVEASMFKDWAEPGFAKTIYALGTRPLHDERTLLWAMMRPRRSRAPPLYARRLRSQIPSLILGSPSGAAARRVA
jgi:hypothetical protein